MSDQMKLWNTQANTLPQICSSRQLFTFTLGLILLFSTTAPNMLPAEIKLPIIGAELTHGPVVSAVTHSSAVIFVRTNNGATVRILYSSDPNFRKDRHRTPGVGTDADGDFTAHIPLTNLEAATTYYYMVFVGVRKQQLLYQPHFTTAPSSETSVDFSFAVLSDLSARPLREAPAYQSVANDYPAFVLQIGDFDHRNPGADWRPSITIDGWRKMHRDVLQDYAAGQDFAEYIGPNFPIYHIWDDHDYGANNADRTAWWKPMATQAFREYYSLPAIPNPDGSNRC